MVFMEELVQAYYWLSSAIAQAFAALIAFTVIVYIYRIGKLDSRLSEIINSLKLVITKHYGPNALVEIHLPFLSTADVLDEAKKRLSEGESEKTPMIEEKMEGYKLVKEHRDNLKKIALGPILISAVTMAIGILALLIGSILSCDTWGWIVMIAESAFATVALGWTVYVVIRILAEPEESKKEGGT